MTTKSDLQTYLLQHNILSIQGKAHPHIHENMNHLCSPFLHTLEMTLRVPQWLCNNISRKIYLQLHPSPHPHSDRKAGATQTLLHRHLHTSSPRLPMAPQLEANYSARLCKNYGMVNHTIITTQSLNYCIVGSC